jgi:hypothetical protein
VVKEIRLYIEGGGDKKSTKFLIHQGFNKFFSQLHKLAQSHKIKWKIILCGSRNNAFRDFQIALKAHPKAFNVLLVDAEAPVNTNACEHLKRIDNWEVATIKEEQCHLMVQTMEAWLIADINTLKQFYGQEFKENSIPTNPNVEQIDKKQLEASLKAATRKTSKGEYHKIQHASKLLGLLNVEKVRAASSHCDHLFTILTNKM